MEFRPATNITTGNATEVLIISGDYFDDGFGYELAPTDIDGIYINHIGDIIAVADEVPC